MKLVISVALSCAIILITVFFALDFVSSDPSTEVLDQDIAAVQSQITAAESERADLGAGALQSVVQVRTEILKTTLAMLEQKRSSILRRVDLTYSINGSRHTPDQPIITSLNADMNSAEDERDRFVAEAARYSGGLIQTIALLNAATSELAIVQINLALLSERHGFLIDLSRNSTAAEPVTQNVVPEDEAL